jgi:glycosyltransferase involved in cell wall biosynthesis
MKIAMLGHKRVPSREGGVEIVVEELSVRMASLGHDVTIYNRYEGEKSAETEHKGVHVVNIPTAKNNSLNAVVYSFFASLRIAFSKCNIIHYHAEGPASMAWIPKLAGKKVVVTIHGLDWQRAKWGKFASRYLLFGERTAVRVADRIIVLSRAAQNYFRDTYDIETTHIPNGVSQPIKHEPEIIRERFGLQSGDYLLFLARIVPEKGLHYLIEAYKDVATDKKLVISGSSTSDSNYLCDLMKNSEDDSRIVFTGHVEGQLLYELYTNAALYVLPSDVEGMPVSLLEAQSYGLPCLVSDIPENIETAPHATTFKRSDIQDLREKLQTFLSGEYHQSLVPIKTWDDIVARTLDLYQSVARDERK